jgi:membrane protein
MVFAIIFLLLVSMFVTAALGVIVDHVTGGGGTEAGFVAKAISYVTDFFVTTLVVWALFMLIYKYLPDVKLRWSDVALGARVTAILFKLGQYALAVYFYFAAPTSAYGAVGSIVAVLLWAYYSACILFFGAEFTQVYTKQYTARPIAPDPEAVPVTDEERAQQGIPRSGDLALSAAAFAPDRAIGPEYARAASDATVPQRRGVTITRPTPESAKAYAVAGVSLAGGFVVGALGLLAGRKYTAHGIDQIRLNQRLDRIESVFGRGKRLQRRALEFNVARRIDDIENRYRAAQRSVRRHQDHRPQWAKRLAELVRPERGIE